MSNRSGGADSVLLRKPRSKVEVYNDLDDEIVGIFRILQSPAQCARLICVC
jgi:DNA adenine methylase